MTGRKYIAELPRPSFGTNNSLPFKVLCLLQLIQPADNQEITITTSGNVKTALALECWLATVNVVRAYNSIKSLKATAYVHCGDGLQLVLEGVFPKSLLKSVSCMPQSTVTLSVDRWYEVKEPPSWEQKSFLSALESP